MSMIKSTAWNGVAVAFRLSSGLALNKILAVLVGPGGYAIIGQFQNAIQIFYTIAAGSINNGITKYTAEYAGDEARQHALWSAAVRIVLFAWVFVAALLVAFHRPVAAYFLGSEQYASIFLWLAVTIGLFSLNTLLLAIVNGKKDLRTFVASNIAGSILILISMAALTWFFGLYGALVAVALHQSLIFFVTIALCRRMPWFTREALFAPFSGPAALRILSFATMAAASAIAINGGQVIVRGILIDRLGLAYAGYWDAMIRISQLNMLLVTSATAFYFIPRMSELTYWEDIRHEIWNGCKLIVPLFVAGALGAYLLRDFVILILFTSDFSPMRSLFGWQLAGDTLRVASFFPAYVLIGKAMIRTYISIELLTNALFAGSSWWLVGRLGFEGVAIAHFTAYAVAIVLMFLSIRISRATPRRVEAASADSG